MTLWAMAQSFHLFFREDEAGHIKTSPFEVLKRPRERAQAKQRRFLERYGRPTERQRMEDREGARSSSQRGLYLDGAELR